VSSRACPQQPYVSLFPRLLRHFMSKRKADVSPRSAPCRRAAGPVLRPVARLSSLLGGREEGIEWRGRLSYCAAALVLGST